MGQRVRPEGILGEDGRVRRQAGTPARRLRLPPAGTVEDPPPVVAGIGSEYIRGIGKLDDRLLILLDLDNLLNDIDLSGS